MIGQDLLSIVQQEPAPPERQPVLWRRWLRSVAGLFRPGQAAEDLPRLPAGLEADSPVMEACRTLRAGLSLGQPGDRPPTLLVMSLAPDPDCALVAAGLAISLAEEGRRTLLVDADLRQPLLHRLFGLERSPGFADALGDAPADPIAAGVAEGLWILPAGAATRPVAQLLRPASVAGLLDDLAGRFEAIVCSSAGRPPHADALLLAPSIGSVVLLVRAGVDTAEQVRRTREALERAGATLLGFAIVDRRR